MTCDKQQAYIFPFLSNGTNLNQRNKLDFWKLLDPHKHTGQFFYFSEPKISNRS
jgi:hypothetical protein